MKSTEGEIIKRVEEIAISLIRGESRECIVQYASNKWELSDRQIDTYISKAKTSIEESVKRNINYDYSMAITRFESLYKIAVDASDYRADAQINKELASLQGLYKLQVEHSGSVQFICNLP